jgi:hypothetical protein
MPRAHFHETPWVNELEKYMAMSGHPSNEDEGHFSRPTASQAFSAYGNHHDRAHPKSRYSTEFSQQNIESYLMSPTDSLPDISSEDRATTPNGKYSQRSPTMLSHNQGPFGEFSSPSDSSVSTPSSLRSLPGSLGSAEGSHFSSTISSVSGSSIGSYEDSVKKKVRKSRSRYIPSPTSNGSSTPSPSVPPVPYPRNKGEKDGDKRRKVKNHSRKTRGTRLKVNLESKLSSLLDEFKQGMKLDGITHTQQIENTMVPLHNGLDGSVASSLDSSLSISSPDIEHFRIENLPSSPNPLPNDEVLLEKVEGAPETEPSVPPSAPADTTKQTRITTTSSQALSMLTKEFGTKDANNRPGKKSFCAVNAEQFKPNKAPHARGLPSEQHVPGVVSKTLTPMNRSRARVKPPKTPKPMPMLQKRIHEMRNQLLLENKGNPKALVASSSSLESEGHIDRVVGDILVEDFISQFNVCLETMYKSFSREKGECLPLKTVERKLSDSRFFEMYCDFLLWHESDAVKVSELFEHIFTSIASVPVSCNDIVRLVVVELALREQAIASFNNRQGDQKETTGTVQISSTPPLGADDRLPPEQHQLVPDSLLGSKLPQSSVSRKAPCGNDTAAGNSVGYTSSSSAQTRRFTDASISTDAGSLDGLPYNHSPARQPFFEEKKSIGTAMTPKRHILRNTAKEEETEPAPQTTASTNGEAAGQDYPEELQSVDAAVPLTSFSQVERTRHFHDVRDSINTASERVHGTEYGEGLELHNSPNAGSGGSEETVQMQQIPEIEDRSAEAERSSVPEQNPTPYIPASSGSSENMNSARSARRSRQQPAASSRNDGTAGGTPIHQAPYSTASSGASRSLQLERFGEEPEVINQQYENNSVLGISAGSGGSTNGEERIAAPSQNIEIHQIGNDGLVAVSMGVEPSMPTGSSGGSGGEEEDDDNEVQQEFPRQTPVAVGSSEPRRSNPPTSPGKTPVLEFATPPAAGGGATVSSVSPLPLHGKFEAAAASTPTGAESGRKSGDSGEGSQKQPLLSVKKQVHAIDANEEKDFSSTKRSAPDTVLSQKHVDIIDRVFRRRPLNHDQAVNLRGFMGAFWQDNDAHDLLDLQVDIRNESGQGPRMTVLEVLESIFATGMREITWEELVSHFSSNKVSRQRAMAWAKRQNMSAMSSASSQLISTQELDRKYGPVSTSNSESESDDSRTSKVCSKKKKSECRALQSSFKVGEISSSPGGSKDPATPMKVAPRDYAHVAPPPPAMSPPNLFSPTPVKKNPARRHMDLAEMMASDVGEQLPRGKKASSTTAAVQRGDDDQRALFAQHSVAPSDPSQTPRRQAYSNVLARMAASELNGSDDHEPRRVQLNAVERKKPQTLIREMSMGGIEQRLYDSRSLLQKIAGQGDSPGKKSSKLSPQGLIRNITAVEFNLPGVLASNGPRHPPRRPKFSPSEGYEALKKSRRQPRQSESVPRGSAEESERAVPRRPVFSPTNEGEENAEAYLPNVSRSRAPRASILEDQEEAMLTGQRRRPRTHGTQESAAAKSLLETLQASLERPAFSPGLRNSETRAAMATPIHSKIRDAPEEGNGNHSPMRTALDSVSKNAMDMLARLRASRLSEKASPGPMASPRFSYLESSQTLASTRANNASKLSRESLAPKRSLQPGSLKSRSEELTARISQMRESRMQNME